MSAPGPSGPSPVRLRAPRAVGADHAFAWFREAMQIWRASPGVFAVIAGVALAVQLLLPLVPAVGVLLAQIVLPLVECALLYASLAADRRDKPRLRHLLAILGASPRAQAAVVVASLLGFGAQWVAADALAQIDLLQPAAYRDRVSLTDLVLIIAAGVALSLPLTFVAPVALFDDPGFGASFRASLGAFARNVMPLLVYAALSVVLFLFGLATSGLGLLLALPWLGASSYAAWKDIFAVDGRSAESTA